MAYEVRYDDGGYCCHFSHGKKKYYADLRDTYEHGNECMSFREGTWNDLYCRRLRSLYGCRRQDDGGLA